MVYMKGGVLPPLFPRKSLVQEGEDFWYVELDILQIKFLLAVFLHLEQVIELEVKLQKTTVAT